MLSNPQEQLIKDFHTCRLVVAGLDIVRADLDACDPFVREDLHSELELVVSDATQVGMTDIYDDAVRLLEELADLEAAVGPET